MLHLSAFAGCSRSVLQPLHAHQLILAVRKCLAQWLL